MTAGTAGGGQVTASHGAVYNPNTGEVTTFGAVRGDNGGVARVGDDVYAGRDGNVYRHTDGGWEHYTPGGGWSPVEGTRPGDGRRGGTLPVGGAGGAGGAGAAGGAGGGTRPGQGGAGAPRRGHVLCRGQCSPPRACAPPGEGGHAAAAAVIGITAAGIAAGGSNDTTSRGPPPSVQQLDRDREARTTGQQRAQGLQRSSTQMNRQFRGGGFRGGRR